MLILPVLFQGGDAIGEELRGDLVTTSLGAFCGFLGGGDLAFEFLAAHTPKAPAQ